MRLLQLSEGRPVRPVVYENMAVGARTGKDVPRGREFYVLDELGVCPEYLESELRSPNEV